MKLKCLNPKVFLATSLVVLGVLVIGCGKDRATQSTESDANGYITKNGYKFYTDRDVFADKCPETGELEIYDVCAYARDDWQPGDTNYVIAPRGAPFRSADGTIYDKIFLPSSKQLEQWGAEYVSAEKVKL